MLLPVQMAEYIKAFYNKNNYNLKLIFEFKDNHTN